MSTIEPTLALTFSAKARANRKRIRQEDDTASKAAVQEFFSKLLPAADEATRAGLNDCWVSFSRKHEPDINMALRDAGFINPMWSNDPDYATGCRVGWPVLPDDE
jgi:hypothetical protein